MAGLLVPHTGHGIGIVSTVAPCSMSNDLNTFHIFAKKVSMPANKNALLRYKTIDNCLRNTSREWTLEDLIAACSDAVCEYTGRNENLSVRTVQLDIQYIETKPLHSSQMVAEREEDGSVIFQICVCLNNELERALLGFGDGVEVLSPPSLRKKIAEVLHSASRRYV